MAECVMEPLACFGFLPLCVTLPEAWLEGDFRKALIDHLVQSLCFAKISIHKWGQISLENITDK